MAAGDVHQVSLPEQASTVTSESDSAIIELQPSVAARSLGSLIGLDAQLIAQQYSRLPSRVSGEYERTLLSMYA
jgi:hypothetical protein